MKRIVLAMLLVSGCAKKTSDPEPVDQISCKVKLTEEPSVGINGGFYAKFSAREVQDCNPVVAHTSGFNSVRVTLQDGGVDYAALTMLKIIKNSEDLTLGITMFDKTNGEFSRPSANTHVETLNARLGSGLLPWSITNLSFEASYKLTDPKTQTMPSFVNVSIELLE